MPIVHTGPSIAAENVIVSIALERLRIVLLADRPLLGGGDFALMNAGAYSGNEKNVSATNLENQNTRNRKQPLSNLLVENACDVALTICACLTLTTLIQVRNSGQSTVTILLALGSGYGQKSATIFKSFAPTVTASRRLTTAESEFVDS